MAIRDSYDVVILGVGPAGLQAAVHAGRRKASVLLLGSVRKSSLFTAHIENYFSLFNISGEEMLKRGTEQARQFGADFLEESVIGIVPDANVFQVTTESGRVLEARSIILATGSKRNTLGVRGEKSLLGRGVSYCVDCDGHFFRGQDVCVVGNESAAADGTLTLIKIAASVHLVCERVEAADNLREEVYASGAVIHEGLRVEAIHGEDAVEAVSLSDGRRLAVQGVFIELGAKGVLELALNLGVALDSDMKYIQTNKQQETNIPGIYAAGDICGLPWQMAKAVGEGCVAGMGAAAYAKKLRAASKRGDA
ncbi:MAG: NAD(P)/FAD-dependent oxidoreductase [Desulfobacterales bacterium]|nr:NAD(P)/FAD-dependent oxidoreductase [Desulfobacterales bacterium]MDJ0886829.1 NAD(P)/FAD-dependent oxidoreductase [Desulfobacterales bacterium]